MRIDIAWSDNAIALLDNIYRFYSKKEPDRSYPFIQQTIGFCRTFTCFSTSRTYRTFIERI